MRTTRPASGKQHRRQQLLPFTASIEVGADGWCTAWVPELRGLFVNEPSEQAALERLPRAIAGYLDWLGRHGEPGPRAGVITVEVIERHTDRAGLRWGGYGALHGFERPPVTVEEVNQALRWMGFMRGETVAFVEALPAKALDWTRPGQTRTIARHLRHIAGAERWYLERLQLGPFPDFGRARDPVDRLRRVRAFVGWRLLRLTDSERERIVKTDHDWWSARKMLGRFLYHERYHLRSMARIATYHRARVPEGLGGWDSYG